MLLLNELVGVGLETSYLLLLTTQPNTTVGPHHTYTNKLTHSTHTTSYTQSCQPIAHSYMQSWQHIAHTITASLQSLTGKSYTGFCATTGGGFAQDSPHVRHYSSQEISENKHKYIRMYKQQTLNNNEKQQTTIPQSYRLQLGLHPNINGRHTCAWMDRSTSSLFFRRASAMSRDALALSLARYVSRAAIHDSAVSASRLNSCMEGGGWNSSKENRVAR